jgi:hypothetical protein
MIYIRCEGGMMKKKEFIEIGKKLSKESFMAIKYNPRKKSKVFITKSGMEKIAVDLGIDVSGITNEIKEHFERELNK